MKKNSVTFDTFKLFFHQKKFAHLQIGPYMACNSDSKKTGQAGENGVSQEHIGPPIIAKI